MAPVSSATLPPLDIYYNHAFHPPVQGANNYQPTLAPGTGKPIASVAYGSAKDVDAAVEAAHKAFPGWAATAGMERARLLRKAAEVLREHAKELATLDAMDTGNPVKEMMSDANVAAANLDYFGGLIPMLKGDTIPQSDSSFHYTIREPLGVVGRIVAFNHPIMFSGGKIAAPLAAGNTVVLKPPDQAPLSTLRMAELIGPIFPPGVLNVVPGGPEVGQRLTAHPLVKKITLIGSVLTGKKIMKGAAEAEGMKESLLELGGKNALIVYPDANPEKTIDGIVKGMNWTWAGQSCGSTSRVFLHSSIAESLLPKIISSISSSYKPGDPLDLDTTMGPVISPVQKDKVLEFIESAKKEGAECALGGGEANVDADLKEGYWIPPTVFVNVKPTMRIAKEEIFGPVLSIFTWSSEDELWPIVNSVPYGLTGSIYTTSIATAHSAIKKIETGYVWVNGVGRHFLGVPFGGQKSSGIGREESLEELIAFTQLKSVNMFL